MVLCPRIEGDDFADILETDLVLVSEIREIDGVIYQIISEFERRHRRGDIAWRPAAKHLNWNFASLSVLPGEQETIRAGQRTSTGDLEGGTGSLSFRFSPL